MKIVIELDPRFLENRVNNIETAIELMDILKTLDFYSDIKKISFQGENDLMPMTLEPHKDKS